MNVATLFIAWLVSYRDVTHFWPSPASSLLSNDFVLHAVLIVPALPVCLPVHAPACLPACISVGGNRVALELVAYSYEPSQIKELEIRFREVRLAFNWGREGWARPL